MGVFTSSGEHYDRHAGRYSVPLARLLADEVSVSEGMRVLDVGCGPGALTSELVGRVGADKVAAIDPAEQFVAACRAGNPGADVRRGVAEELPWEDDAFDAALSSLVIAYMSDPDAGLREMARVTRPGGKVGACMWDIADGVEMLRLFWAAMEAVSPDPEPGPAPPAGATEGEIAARLVRAGLGDVATGALEVSAEYADFEDLWTPLAFAVGPSGKALAALDDKRRRTVRKLVGAALPDGPFTLSARAWFGTATV